MLLFSLRKSLMKCKQTFKKKNAKNKNWKSAFLPWLVVLAARLACSAKTAVLSLWRTWGLCTGVRVQMRFCAHMKITKQLCSNHESVGTLESRYIFSMWWTRHSKAATQAQSDSPQAGPFSKTPPRSLTTRHSTVATQVQSIWPTIHWLSSQTKKIKHKKNALPTLLPLCETCRYLKLTMRHSKAQQSTRKLSS